MYCREQPFPARGCRDRGANALPSELANAIGAADQDVEDRANEVSQDDDEDPHDLGVALVRLFRGAVHESPAPEAGAGDADLDERLDCAVLGVRVSADLGYPVATAGGRRLCQSVESW